MDRLVSFAFQVWYEMPVSPSHFYSPLPDIQKLKRNLSRWYREGSLAGIEMASDQQKAFLGGLAAYRAECDNLPSFHHLMCEGYGLGYGEVEAHLLHCVIRKIKPRRIIEVGSGVSTYFALNALGMNRQRDGVDSAMDCIEPYPSEKLQELVRVDNVRLHVSEIQDIEIGLFKKLCEGDILFIDSSHVSKIDSDVNHLYLEILPSLRKGVVIHIHDIPFPYLTLMPGHPIFDASLFWNEAALTRAFLMYNDAFEIVMSQSWLHYKCPEAIKAVARIYDPGKHFPSSLWLRKVA